MVKLPSAKVYSLSVSVSYAGQSPECVKVTTLGPRTLASLKNANEKGADRSARSMRMLVCAFVVRKPPKTGFLASRPS